MEDKGSLSLEKIFHFRCASCGRWWSIADAPGNPSERMWFCPWCGKEQSLTDTTPKHLV
jgi:predicted RNA-binding Zn-ribbon protein involved in translation (DUF1610 family)